MPLRIFTGLEPANDSFKFVYSPLPSSTSIRLLEIKPKFWGRAEYALHIVELGNAPAFNVLSYSRGDSHIPRVNSKECHVSQCRHSIRCDGLKLPISSDVKHALSGARTARTKSVGAAKLRYIWIETLCINPEDPAERGAQISIITDIYKTAQNVLVWLGSKASTTSDAIKALKRLSAIPRDEYSTLVRLDWAGQVAYFERLSITPLQLRHWLSLIIFFNKCWFSNIWAVQEITVANNVAMICGKTVISWEIISKALSFLTHTGWYQQLHTKRLSSLPNSVSQLGRQPKRCQKLLEEDLGVGMAIIQLESTRAGIVSTKQPALFRYLLRAHRHCEAIDKRDMIYGLLGISRKDNLPFTRSPKAILPDYEISVHDLYTKVAKVLLQSYGLGILSDVQDSLVTSVASLPSWVPDYSVPRRPMTLLMRGDCTWNTSGDLNWDHELQEIEGGALRLQGIPLDSICDRSTKVTKSLQPAEFWDGVYEVASHLDPIYPLQVNGKFQPSREVVWRTILADTYDNQYPAPPECEQIFTLYQEWARNGTEAKYSMQRLSVHAKSEVDIPKMNFTQVEKEVEETNDARTIFRTRKGYLGIGAQSLQAFDEVWILAGANVPFILRQEKDGTYRLIGEAYLHGVMHGEALEWGHELRNISLT